MRNFTVEAEGAWFESITMHVREVRLFQVYVMHEGTKRRFHMQRNDDGDFYITNKDHCPAEFHKAEELLKNIILLKLINLLQLVIHYATDFNITKDCNKTQILECPCEMFNKFPAPSLFNHCLYWNFLS